MIQLKRSQSLSLSLSPVVYCSQYKVNLLAQ